MMTEVRANGASAGTAGAVAGEGEGEGAGAGAGAALASSGSATAVPLGSPELAVARAMAQLEEQRDRLQESRHEARRLERHAQARQISEMRRAGRFGLAAGLVQAGGEAASGAMGMAGAGGSSGAAGGSASGGGLTAQQSGALGQIAQAAGGLADAGLRHGQTVAEIDAEEARHDAKAHADVADRLDDERRRSERLSDKMRDHLARIADARMQARLEAARG